MAVNLIRQRWQFSGTVQGVGFRVTARRIASRFKVRGFVQNQSDGSVLIEVQGSLEMLGAFRAEIEHQLQHRIEAVNSTQLSTELSETEPPGFLIRY